MVKIQEKGPRESGPGGDDFVSRRFGEDNL